MISQKNLFLSIQNLLFCILFFFDCEIHKMEDLNRSVNIFVSLFSCSDFLFVVGR